MHCKKAEESIVLYSELTQDEKSQLEAHLKNCAACSTLASQIQSQQEIFLSAKLWKPEIENPVTFTDRIMEALPAKKFQSEKKKKSVRMLFNWTPLQTSLVACSLMLIISFCVEFMAVDTPIEQQTIIKNGVPLIINPQKLIQSKRNRTNLFSLEKMIAKNSSIAFSE